MSNRNLTLLCLSLFLLLPTPVLAMKDLEDEVRDFTLSARAFQDHHYGLVQKRLESFLEYYPRSEKFQEALLLLGRSYLELGKFQEALQTFSRLTQQQGVSRQQNEQALYWMGETHVRLRDFSKAEEIFQRLIALPASQQLLPYATYALAESRQETGDLEKAIDGYTQLVDHFATHPLAEDTRFRTLTCLLGLKQLDRLETELQNFLAAYPDSRWRAEALYLQGELFGLKGKHQESAAAYQQALSLSSPEEPWRTMAQLHLAWMLFHLKKYEEASSEFNTLRETQGPLQENVFFGEALCAVARGRFSEALDLLDTLLERSPNGEFAAKAQLERGGLLYRQNRIPEAALAYRRVLALAKDGMLKTEAFYGLGWVSLRQNAEQEAIASFQQVAQDSPDASRRAQALCHIGDIYQDKKELQEAVETYQRVLQETPSVPQVDYASLQIGIAYLKTHHLQEAVTAFESFLSQFPKSALWAEGEYQLGMAYFEMGQFGLARSCFEKVPAEANRTLYESSRFQVANSLYNLKQYQEALPLFQSLTQEGQLRIASLSQYQIGWCFYQMGEREKAVEAFQDYLVRYPSSEIAPEVHFWLAEYYIRFKEQEKAMAHFRDLVETFPSSPLSEEVLFRWASLLAEKGERGAARERFDQLLSRYPTSSFKQQVFLEKAMLLVDDGDTEGAQAVVEEIFRQFPQTGLSRLASQRLAGLLKKQNRYPEAIDYFKKAQTGDEYEPNAQIQYEIGVCYEGMGELDKALGEYLKLSSTYPKSTYWVVHADVRLGLIFEKLGRLKEAMQTYEKLASWDRLEEAGFARERLKVIRQQLTAH